MTVTQPTSRFGVVEIEESGLVSQFKEKPKVNDWINMGYFVFQPPIFDLLETDSVLEDEPLRSLASSSELGAFKHSGFWQPMDTYREYLALNDLWSTESAPWKSW
jgi:glucose-1-phosphate cytidylyltransferase